MQYLRAKFMKWKRPNSAQKYTRIDDFRDQLFEAIHENDFELSKIIIDRMQSVNIKNIDGATPPSPFVSRRHWKLKKRLSSLFTFCGRVVLYSAHRIVSGRQPCIMQTLMDWRRSKKVWIL